MRKRSLGAKFLSIFLHICNLDEILKDAMTCCFVDAHAQLIWDMGEKFVLVAL